MTNVHSYDDPAIIAGHGTLGLEMASDAGGRLDHVFVSIGGGGFSAGVGGGAEGARSGRAHPWRRDRGRHHDDPGAGAGEAGGDRADLDRPDAGRALRDRADHGRGARLPRGHHRRARRRGRARARLGAAERPRPARAGGGLRRRRRDRPQGHVQARRARRSRALRLECRARRHHRLAHAVRRLIRALHAIQAFMTVP